jgi:hypothetical protein
VNGNAQVRILATGVRLDEHPNHEAALVEQVGRHGMHLSPEQRADLARGRTGEVVFVRVTAFVEFDAGSGLERWEETPQGPFAVEAHVSATSALLHLVEHQSQLPNLLADFGLGGIAVSRFQFEAAPRRIDVEPTLAGRLMLD